MRIVHESADTPANERRVLAKDVEFADSLLTQGRGLMFRRSIPDDYALVFRFGRAHRRRLHMLFVPFDIDAVWLHDGRVRRVKRLQSWFGHGMAIADTVIEFAKGTADGVETGDRVFVEREGTD